MALSCACTCRGCLVAGSLLELTETLQIRLCTEIGIVLLTRCGVLLSQCVVLRIGYQVLCMR